MSYILQALAQSERERQNADAPDLERVFDVETPTQTGQRRKRFIIGVLLVNAVVIAALILLGDFQLSGKAGTTTAAVTDSTPRSTSTTGEIPAPKQEATSIKIPPQLTNTAASDPGLSMPINNTPADVATTLNKPVKNLPIADINKTATQNALIEDLPVVDTIKTAMQNIPIKDTSTTKIPVMKPKPIDNELAEVARQQQAKVVGLTGIDHVRTLPGIDMSVHVYSEKIAERFVFVNGQEYREGDTLTADGAQLAAITPDGIVVDFGNRRVLLARIR